MKMINSTDRTIRISLLDGFSTTVAPKQVIELPKSRLEMLLYHGLSQAPKKVAKGKV
jgi:hypothetical protein